MDTSKNPAPFQPYVVSVRVKGLGYAIVAPAENYTTTFELIPSIKSIAPKRGSIAGGTKIVLTGQGYIDGMSVMIGAAECTVTEVLFSKLTCTIITSEIWEKLNQTVGVSLTKDNQQHTGICKASDGFTFDFMDIQTPEVTQIEPATIRLPNTVITLRGTKVRC